MKKKLFMLLAATFTVMSASAQIVTSENRTLKTIVEKEVHEYEYYDNGRYAHLSLELGNISAKVTGHYKNNPLDIPTFSGLGCVGYNAAIGFPFYQGSNWYFETGFNMSFKFLDKEKESTNGNNHLDMGMGVNFECPLNIAYRFQVKKGTYILPSVGFVLGYSSIGSEYTVKRGNTTTKWEFDISNKEYGGGFMAGPQLGLTIDINKFNIGFVWEKNLVDIMPPVEKKSKYNDASDYNLMKLKYSEFKIRVGYTLHGKSRRMIY